MFHGLCGILNFVAVITPVCSKLSVKPCKFLVILFEKRVLWNIKMIVIKMKYKFTISCYISHP